MKRMSKEVVIKLVNEKGVEVVGGKKLYLKGENSNIEVFYDGKGYLEVMFGMEDVSWENMYSEERKELKEALEKEFGI